MKLLGFGAMRMPLTSNKKGFDHKQIAKMIDTFIERGFTHFDTAPGYHAGASQKVLKKHLTSKYPRNAYTLSTKMSPWLIKQSSDMETLFANQLEDCGVEYFDKYLLHAINKNYYDNVFEKFNAFDFINQKKKAGKIKKVGFSFHDTPEVLELILAKHAKHVDFVLLQLNYLDWEDPGVQSRRCYEVARKYKLPVMVMEPVKGGTLANVPREVEELFKEHNPKLSPASYAVRFVAGLEGVEMVLSGMSNLKQLDDNTSYMQNFKPLDSAELILVKKAGEIIASKVAVRCTYCAYCIDEGCPKKIAIPGYFALYNTVKRGDPNPFNQHMYYGVLASTNGKASECINCKKCEKVCPQKIDIPKHLKEVAEVFEKKQ